MVKLFLGSISLLSAVIMICTGFIVSALTHQSGYSLFRLSLWWIIIPVAMAAIGIGLLVSYQRDEDYDNREED
ncbi:hypothetical protein Q5741_11585 [Paenibacillus sp. JX-17]|uniref:Uncharacterized protein n=1 Tax=Paenibacillus lacisoli TaxID=3064525 RepID=A0ABT9CER4_9BACL|nr:hypothetical protein [Paenibacillus sp. JX-17]MDO7907058.1 hypothetical protein [Paenibacillus sp. JX-17]